MNKVEYIYSKRHHLRRLFVSDSAADVDHLFFNSYRDKVGYSVAIHCEDGNRSLSARVVDTWNSTPSSAINNASDELFITRPHESEHQRQEVY